jgi:hypothetical protein
VDPTQVYGWRLDRETNYGSLTQVRIGEKAVIPDGEFGEKVYDQVRVIEPGRYRIFRQEEQKKEMQGNFPYPSSFDQSDATAKDMAISVNYAMATQPGNKVYYVEPAASAFEAQSAEIQELQQQMATLGISTLSQQKFVAESADARRLDRIDTNSMLSMVSMDLEAGLQKAYDMAADYLGLEPPEVKISRDFDLQRLIGQDIAAMAQLFEDKVIDREEFRDMLVQGEILPNAAESPDSAPELQ